MTRTNRIACALTLAAGASAGACDSLATQDYAGEPLLQLRGEVRASLEAAPQNLKIGIVYAGPQVDGGQLLRHIPAEVEGDFPARFTVTIREPPPDDVVFEGRAVAALVAADELPDGDIVYAGSDPLALADAAGWRAVAPLNLVHLDERRPRSW